MTETIPAIFAIIGLSADKMARNIGTGFFINESGNYVTAAHTFKKAQEGWNYFAVISKSLVALDNQWLEYRDLSDQVAPIHMDLCLGHFNLDQHTDFLTLSPSRELKTNDKLDFKGYASTPYTDNEPREIVVPILSNIKMEDLWAEVASGDDEDQKDDTNEEFEDPFEFIAGEGNKEDSQKELNLDDEITKLQYSEITGTFTQSDFEEIFEYFPVEGIFTNGFTFSLTNAKTEPSGLSGCPVLCHGKAAGMLITKNAAISSEYIIEQLEKQEIHFHTNSDPAQIKSQEGK